MSNKLHEILWELFETIVQEYPEAVAAHVHMEAGRVKFTLTLSTPVIQE